MKATQHEQLLLHRHEVIYKRHLIPAVGFRTDGYNCSLLADPGESNQIRDITPEDTNSDIHGAESRCVEDETLHVVHKDGKCTGHEEDKARKGLQE